MKKTRKSLLLIAAIFVLAGPSLMATPSVATIEYNSENTLRVAWTDSAGVGLKDADAALAHTIEDANFLINVLEGLFELDYTDDARPMVPRLANSSDWMNRTCFEVDLREDVTFHDGSAFNASVVLWNLERTYNLMWTHAEVRYAQKWIVDASTYEPLMSGNSEYDDFDLSWVPDVGGGYRPVSIINMTEEVEEYTVRFHLNIPYASIKDLLAASTAMMISPTSHADMLNATFTPALTELIGTGPFTFDSYDQIDKEIVLFSNEDYYRGAAAIKKLTFTFFADANAKNIALLSDEVDLITDFDASTTADIQNDESLIVEIKPVSIQANWISFNHDHINKTMRKALSYAYNYDYIMTELLENETLGERMEHAIPAGIKYTDDSLDTVVFDLDIARQTLIDAGIAPTGFTTNTSDEDWADLADSTSGSYSPLLQINHTYMPGSSEFSDTVYLNVKNSFALIGVEVLAYELNAESDYVPELLSPNTDTAALSWTPGEMDPTPYLELIWRSSSFVNFAHMVNADLDGNITLSYLAADDAEKKVAVQNIQRILEEEYAAIWHLQPRGALAYSEGWIIPDVNGMNIERYYNMSFDVDEPTTDPEDDAGTIPGFGTASLLFVSLMSVIGLTLMKRKR